MEDITIADGILAIAQAEINKILTNQDCIIMKVYDSNYVDISTAQGIIKYVKCIGSPEIDMKAVLLFMQNDFNNRIVICQGESGGGGDLSAYVKKSDVQLKFNLNNDGTITIGINVGSGFIDITKEGKSWLQNWFYTKTEVYTKSEINSALNTKSDIGECITSIELLPKSTDVNGRIRLYYGDE